jgi:hypothetical protein
MAPPLPPPNRPPHHHATMHHAAHAPPCALPQVGQRQLDIEQLAADDLEYNYDKKGLAALRRRLMSAIHGYQGARAQYEEVRGTGGGGGGWGGGGGGCCRRGQGGQGGERCCAG